MSSGVVIPGSSSRDLLGKDPKIFNVNLVGDVENSYTFVSSTRRIMIKARNSTALQVAFVASETTTNYFTLHPGSVFDQENLDQTFTVYFRASQAEVVEILTWSRV